MSAEQMMPGFAAATAVTREGPTSWSARVADGWDIAGNANGGYLLALAASAAAEAAGRPDPVTVTGHYLAPGRPGPVRIESEPVKVGRQFTSTRALLVDEERAVLAVLATFSELAASDRGSGGGLERVDAAPPALPAPDDCVAIEPNESFPLPFMGRVELRLHPDDAGFAVGRPSGRPRVRGWFRLRGEEPVSTLALLVAVDAFPPTVFNAALPAAWTPTLELTAHVRARPRTGWLRCAFTTRFITGGFVEEDGEVWDGTGRLVAQSRQLALMPRS